MREDVKHHPILAVALLGAGGAAVSGVLIFGGAMAASLLFERGSAAGTVFVAIVVLLGSLLGSRLLVPAAIHLLSGRVRFPPNSGQVFKQLSPHLSGIARSE